MLQTSKNFQNFPVGFPMNFSGKLTAKIVIKKDFIRADGTCAMYVQVFLNGIKKKIPLRIFVTPDNFDSLKQRIKTKSPFANDYNLIIEKSLADINRIEINYRLLNIPLTIEKLMDEFTNPNSRLDFINFWTLEMENQKQQLKPNTYRQQMTMLNKLKEFKPTVYFYEINEEFINKLLAHLKNKLKNNDNTIASFVKSFKKYLHIANKRGIITPIMHDDIKRGNFTSERIFLMPDEIRKLNKYFHSEFILATHKAILSRFLFSCFSGLRISDIKQINQDNFIDDILIFVVEKTGKMQRMKLNNSALSYIDPEVIFYGNFTDEYINRELKFIAKACGISKSISFHTSRHTFATNYLLSGGDVVSLQKLLGHSKITDTMIYVHIVDSITDIKIMSMDDILKINTL